LPESGAIEGYRRIVATAIYPDPFSHRPVSVREANTAIAEYRRATGDVAGAVDLMRLLERCREPNRKACSSDSFSGRHAPLFTSPDATGDQPTAEHRTHARAPKFGKVERVWGGLDRIF